jgi:hypothetical protein
MRWKSMAVAARRHGCSTDRLTSTFQATRPTSREESHSSSSADSYGHYHGNVGRVFGDNWGVLLATSGPASARTGNPCTTFVGTYDASGPTVTGTLSGCHRGGGTLSILTTVVNAAPISV